MAKKRVVNQINQAVDAITVRAESDAAARPCFPQRVELNARNNADYGLTRSISSP